MGTVAKGYAEEIGSNSLLPEGNTAKGERAGSSCDGQVQSGRHS